MIFNNSTAIITGGSSGIGFSIAKDFARRGCSILLVARNKEKLQIACENLMKDFPAIKASYFSLDISCLKAENFNDVSEKINKILINLPQIRFLINGAGAAFPGEISNRDPQLIETTISLNFTGLALFTRMIIPLLKPGSKIINISSLGGIFPIFGLADYGGAKMGVILFSDALRSELKPKGIAVHVLCPPDTDTPGFANENLTKPEETAVISGKAKLKNPDIVAKVLMKGLVKNKFMILPDFGSYMNWLIARISPSLVRKLFDSEIDKIQKKRNKQECR